MNDDTLLEYLNHINANRENKRPPTSKKIIERLKKFNMTDKYCKNNNGKLEFPNCAICISDIVKNEETILLPCGHMYHSKCIVEWLNQNNKCPVCRFELRRLDNLYYK
jgi:E3 ubiquitin-protein ligase RNF115/126